GIDAWGGGSPGQSDHVNPEAPWPELEALRAATEWRGLTLAPRLCVYPEYVVESDHWLDPAVAQAVRLRADADGLAREDDWAAGADVPVPASGKGAPILLPEATVVGNGARVGSASAPKR